MTPNTVSIAVPTYCRSSVLLDTLLVLMGLDPPAHEILVVDQTQAQDATVVKQLCEWNRSGIIRWEKRDKPSVPAAMNHAIQIARCPIVLFLDDDVKPDNGIVQAHAQNYDDPAVWAVTGQVLQPGQLPCAVPDGPRKGGIWKDLDFPFNSTERHEVSNCMAGNLSVRRGRALEVGCFDENFVKVAYRFETEFCRRLASRGAKIIFDPTASVRHLRFPEGGMRTYANQLRSCKPDHSVGDYYFALLQGLSLETLSFIAHRMMTEVRTRYHLTHPWWIPPKLLGEIRGLIWAVRLRRCGPSYMDS